jgi:transcriptional regulator with XRE-family HTH domain
VHPKNITNVSIGSRIRQARKALKLTQEGLAKALSLSTVTLNRIENDRRSPTSEILMKVADVLKCDARWIIGGDGEIASDNEVGTETDCLTESISPEDVKKDPVLTDIILLLENDLPEAKENIRKILVARKQMREGINALGLGGN